MKINSERATDRNSIYFDKAAIIYDRVTKSKYLKLWKEKLELPLPPFNVLQQTDKGDFLELKRTAEDRFYFMTATKTSKTYTKLSDGKSYPMMDTETSVIDPDLAYWITKRKGKNKSMFDPERPWMKFIPYIPSILGGVITIVILYILMSNLPGILSELKELTQAR